jgi:hypothetical protein
VTAQSRSGQGAAQVLLLPGIGDGTFGSAQLLATVGTAGRLDVGDFNGDGVKDLAVADKGGVTIIYGTPASLTPNNTQATARNLGNAAHVVTLTQAIVTGHEDAYFNYTVPTDSAPGSGPQVVDFSALFQDETAGGLQMDILDSSGTVLNTGSDRYRVVAAQGAVLTVRIHGASGTGNGAYTLDIDVLPQVVSVQSDGVLPGGPASELIVTLQGDRLDPATAENPANYTVTWAGPDGVFGTADDQVIPAASADGAGQPIVYDASANDNVSSGLTYRTNVRQTVTLNFAEPLQPGSYRVTLTAGVQTAAFSASESALLVGSGFGGHPVVSVAGVTVSNGGSVTGTNVVTVPATATGNPDLIGPGTPFMTQLQNDLGALLDSKVASNASEADISAAINGEIIDRFTSAYGVSSVSGNVPLPFAIIWLDPVSLGVQQPQGQRTSYDLKSNTVDNTTATRTFIEVGGNIEVVVVAGKAGQFKLDVADVPEAARGGVVVLSPQGNQSESFTEALRGGTNQFIINIPVADVVLGNPGSTGGGENGGTGGTIAGAIGATGNGATSAVSAVNAATNTTGSNSVADSLALGENLEALTASLNPVGATLLTSLLTFTLGTGTTTAGTAGGGGDEDDPQLAAVQGQLTLVSDTMTQVVQWVLAAMQQAAPRPEEEMNAPAPQDWDDPLAPAWLEPEGPEAVVAPAASEDEVPLRPQTGRLDNASSEERTAVEVRTELVNDAVFVDDWTEVRGLTSTEDRLAPDTESLVWEDPRSASALAVALLLPAVALGDGVRGSERRSRRRKGKTIGDAQE